MFLYKSIHSVWTLAEQFCIFERFSLKVSWILSISDVDEKSWTGHVQIPKIPSICYKCMINIWRFLLCWFILKTLKVFAAFGNAVDEWLACDFSPFSTYSHSLCALSIWNFRNESSTLYRLPFDLKELHNLTFPLNETKKAQIFRELFNIFA